MKLSENEKRMIAGERGPGVQKALAMLVKYGDAFGAERMVRVEASHAGTGPLPFVREMLEGVDRIPVLATLHAGGAAASPAGAAMGLPEKLCQQEQRSQVEAVALCTGRGFVPAMSCAPYLCGNLVRPGTVFSWPGSSGIIISNSLFGGRGNRDAFPASLASSITGLTPDMLLMRKENRRAQVTVTVKDDVDVGELTEADFGAMGYYIGGIAQLRNVVIDGLPKGLSFGKLKNLLAPMPVSGAVSLCHVVGVTPEAPTLEDALGGNKPEVSIGFGQRELLEARKSLHTAKHDAVEVVFFGCPHLTLPELGEAARLLSGKRKADGVRLWVSTAESVRTLAAKMGYVEAIERAGGLVITDTCIMGFPYDQLESRVSSAATDSARAASYQARRGIGIQYGSFSKCINAALTGKWVA